MMPVQQAAPLAVLLSITIAAFVVAQDWRKIHFRSAGGLLLATAFGTPIGLLLLKIAQPSAIRIVLAIFLLAYCSYSLLGRATWELKKDSWRWMAACGLCAGILGGACGMNGPPLVVYGTLRRWTSQHFRATLQAYFLPASLMVMLGYRMAGLWTPAVTRNYLFSLPVLLPALLLGRFLNARLHGNGFQRLLYLGLIAIAILLLSQSLR
uniref:Membrane transporter protein n=1 Tax=mine drainage metagenome TaxID=410659 RepID=E6QMP6_9ZZZZ